MRPADRLQSIPGPQTALGAAASPGLRSHPCTRKSVAVGHRLKVLSPPPDARCKPNLQGSDLGGGCLGSAEVRRVQSRDWDQRPHRRDRGARLGHGRDARGRARGQSPLRLGCGDAPGPSSALPSPRLRSSPFCEVNTGWTRRRRRRIHRTVSGPSCTPEFHLWAPCGRGSR